MEQISQRNVLIQVLRQVLAREIAGLPTYKVYEIIEQMYDFPADWYRELPAGDGYKELQKYGIDNWRDISQERLLELVKTEPQWRNEIRWARNALKDMGHLNPSAPYGVWQLTPEGIAATFGGHFEKLSPGEKKIATPKVNVVAIVNVAPQQLSTKTDLRKELNEKLLVITSSMPLNDLDLLLDIARTIRKRSIDV